MESMNLHDFYYDLPQELIAQDPLSDRSSSRLMVLDKKTGEIQHKIFKDVIDYLNPGDCLVINDTKVIPARLIGEKVGTGAAIEVLLLTRKQDLKDTWEVLVKPGKRQNRYTDQLWRWKINRRDCGYCRRRQSYDTIHL